MNRRIFISKNDSPQGPFSDEQLGLKLISGEIEPQTLACEDGAQSWRTIGELLDPQFVSKSMEFRRASQSLTPTLLNQSRMGASSSSSMLPAAFPSTPPAGAAATPPRGIPTVSLMEPNGQPIRPPSQFPASQFPSSAMPTSLPMPASATAIAALVAAGAPPAAGAALPSVPSAPATSSQFKLAVEEIGAEERKGGRGRKWLIAGGVAAVLGVAGFFAYEPLEHRWRARENHQAFQSAMAAGQFQEAMQAAHVASTLMPDSGIYVTALQEARHKAFDALKARAGKESPLEHLIYARGFLKKLEPVLGEDTIALTRDWIEEVEPLVLKQIKTAFDTEIASLNTLLAPHEGKLGALFNTPQNREEAQRLHDQWKIQRDACAAWDAGQPVKAVELLATVAEDLRKKIYSGAYLATQKLRTDLLEKLRGAGENARAQKFLETIPTFAALEPYTTWIPEIVQEKQRIQLGGENFYASRLVEAVRGRDEDAARENLKSYMQFRRRPLADEQINAFLSTKTFKEYLAKLTEYGLRPEGKAPRQNYADVILTASNLPNFTDGDAAHAFLAESYLAWGQREFEKGRSSPAAYLALLATKHGNPAAAPLFESAHAKVRGEFTVAVRPTPVTMSATRASKSFAEQLEIDAVNAIRATLPGWIKWRTPEDAAAAGEAEPSITLKFVPALTEFVRRNDRTARNVSQEFRFEDIIEENPAYYRAQEDVQRAQNAVVQAQNDQVAANQAATQAANTNYGSNMGLGMAAAILGGVSKGVSDAALRNAQSALVNAQSRLNQTPRQVRKLNMQTVSWTETDYKSQFNSTFRVDVVIADKSIASLAATASTVHESTEREGGYGGRVTPMQRQEPNNETIETKLLEQLKPQVAALRRPQFLAAIKNGLGLYVAQQTTGVDAEAQANTLMGLELLWWDHPLRDKAALRAPELLGRFGDVID